MLRAGAIIALAALLLSGATAWAQDRDHGSGAQLELGAAGEWGRSGEQSFGPSAAIEFAAIAERLEIEVGIAPMLGKDQPEWDTELIFKTPLYDADNIEVTFGLGPEWQLGRSIQGADTIHGAAQIEFEFWRPDRKVGWFVEPGYSYSFASSREGSLGVTVGLLVALP